MQNTANQINVSAEMVLTHLSMPDLLQQEVAAVSAMRQRHQQEDTPASHLSPTQPQSSAPEPSPPPPSSVVTVTSQSQTGGHERSQLQENKGGGRPSQSAGGGHSAGGRPSQSAGGRPSQSAGGRPSQSAGGWPSQSAGGRPSQSAGGRPSQSAGGWPSQSAGGRPSQSAGGWPSQPAGGWPSQPAGGRPSQPAGGWPSQSAGGRPSQPAGGGHSAGAAASQIRLGKSQAVSNSETNGMFMTPAGSANWSFGIKQTAPGERKPTSVISEANGDSQADVSRPGPAVPTLGQGQQHDMDTSALDLFEDSVHESVVQPSMAGKEEEASGDLLSAASDCDAGASERREQESVSHNSVASSHTRVEKGRTAGFLSPSHTRQAPEEPHPPIRDSCISQTIHNRIRRTEVHQTLLPLDQVPPSAEDSDLLDNIDRDYSGRLTYVRKRGGACSESSKQLASRLKDKLNSFVRGSGHSRLSHRDEEGATVSEIAHFPRESDDGLRRKNSTAAEQEVQLKKGMRRPGSSKKQCTVISDSEDDSDNCTVKEKMVSSAESTCEARPKVMKEPSNCAANESISALCDTPLQTDAADDRPGRGSASAKPSTRKPNSSSRKPSVDSDHSWTELDSSNNTPKSRVALSTLSKLKQFSFSSSPEESPSPDRGPGDGQGAGLRMNQTSPSLPHHGPSNKTCLEAAVNTDQHLKTPADNDGRIAFNSREKMSGMCSLVNRPGVDTTAVSSVDRSRGSAANSEVQTSVQTQSSGAAVRTVDKPKHSAESAEVHTSLKTPASTAARDMLFTLPEDSDDDLDDSFTDTKSTKKRKCFQLSSDAEGEKGLFLRSNTAQSGQQDKLSTVPNSLSGRSSSQLPGDTMNHSKQDDDHSAAAGRCHTPSILLQSQDSLTLSQSSRHDAGQGQSVAKQQRLPTIGGTPSNSQSTARSCTPVVSKGCVAESPLPDAMKRQTNGDSSATCAAKKSSAVGKTTPAWLVQLNTQRSCPTPASTASHAASSPFLAVGDSDGESLDWDLDFDRPFKKQRKS